MRLFLILSFILVQISLSGQQRMERYSPFDKDPNARPSGMYIGIGGTYTIPGFSENGEYLDSLNTYALTFNNKGKLGPFFEIGRWHILNYGPFQSMEYGLSYRQYGGKEDYTAMELPDLMNGEFASIGRGTFNSHYAHFNIQFNSTLKLSKLSFIQASFGADVGYRFINSNTYEFEIEELAFIRTSEVRETIDSHLNFRLSYGTRVNRLYWLPFVQTSFFNVRELGLRDANLPYFNSRYKPVIFGLRLQWLHHKKNRECAKKGPKNKKTYKKSKSLFGKEMKNNQLRK